jgi:hypothetical protein
LAQPAASSSFSDAHDEIEVIKDNPAGLSRGEVIERLHLKGDKAGEASVSNALTALVERQQIVRRERKYRVE